MKFKIYKKNNNWFLQFDKNDFLQLIERAVKKYIQTAINSFIEKNILNFYYAEIALYLLIVASLEFYYLTIFVK